MNLNDLITVAKILKVNSETKLQGTSKEDFMLGLAHIKIFIDNYFNCLALTDVELALTIGKRITVPQSILKSKADFIPYDDGEICLKPL